jgi:hypothetical protein
MRKSIIALSIAGIFGYSTVVLADAQTQDSTNTYSPASQNVEKLHQKPMAGDSENAKKETKRHRPHTHAKKSDEQKDLEERASQSQYNTENDKSHDDK